MSVLIDTCILRELHLPRPYWRVRRAVDDLWMEDVHLSVISIGIMESGVSRLPQEFKQRRVRGWIRDVTRKLGTRLLGFDQETALQWGQVLASAKRRKLSLPFHDSIMVATARRHHLKVMTRNVGSFAPFQVEVFNPWGDPVEAAYDFGEEPASTAIEPGSTSAELVLPFEYAPEPETAEDELDHLELLQAEPAAAEMFGRRASDHIGFKP